MEPGNNDVGMATSIAPTDTPETAGKTGRARSQGAMSLQGFGWHGNECYPQKLVQLVGHREARTAPDMWDRLRQSRLARQTADSAT